MSSDEVRELYEVRAALEGIVALRAAKHADSDRIAQLDAIVGKIISAQKCGDISLHSEGVHEFYETLRAASGNRLLHAQLSAMSERMAWLRGFTLSRPDRAAVAVQDEIRLLDAIKARDGDLARKLCEAQIKATGEAVVTAWQA